MFVVELLMYVAFLCWGFFTVFVLLGLVGLVLYRPRRASVRAGNVVCVIVSVADRRVEKVLLESVRSALGLGVPVVVLVDEGCELCSELEGLSKALGFTLVAVPRGYRRDLVGKGRAINYFAESVAEDGVWYAFLDDDNLVLDDSFLYEIPYYESRGYVAMNPVLVPRPGRSRLVYAMDFIRFFDDLFCYRFFTGLLGRPLVGLHGELLTVKGSVLKEVGFNHRSVTEDFRFAAELVRRGYRVWQSATKVSIKSPNSVKDLMKQRGRWFKGIARDWLHAPTPMKVAVGVRLLLWVLGVFGSWALSPLWLFWRSFYFALPGGIYYWLMYIYGVLKAWRPRYLPLIPAFGVIESLSLFAGLRQKGFTVIDKN